MHRMGHTGIVLLLYAPVSYLLLSTGQLGLAVLGLVGMLVIEPVPDKDMYVPGFTHRGGAGHSLLTAVIVGTVIGIGSWWLSRYLVSVTVAAITGAADGVSALLSFVPSVVRGFIPVRFDHILYAVAVQVAGIDPAALGWFGFCIGALAIISHLAGDVLTPMGVLLFWPLSTTRFTLDSVGVRPFRPISSQRFSLSPNADSRRANPLLFGIGLCALATAAGVGISFTVLTDIPVAPLFREVLH